MGQPQFGELAGRQGFQVLEECLARSPTHFLEDLSRLDHTHLEPATRWRSCWISDYQAEDESARDSKGILQPGNPNGLDPKH